MKEKRSTLISLIILFVIIAGAYVLYKTLTEFHVPESNLAALPGAAEPGNLTESEAETDSCAPSVPDGTEDTAAQTGEAPDEAETEAAEPEKYAAPDFTVYDYEGNAHKLSDFVGKPVVLNFWASWCGPCKSEMPEFDAAFAEYGSEINFLIVNLTDGSRETVESAKSHIDANGYTFPVYYDTDMDAAMKYGVTSIPATYFIDSEGFLAAYGIGAMDSSTLEKGIGMVYSAD